MTAYIKPRAEYGLPIQLQSDREPDGLATRPSEGQERRDKLEKLGYGVNEKVSFKCISVPNSRMSFWHLHTEQLSVFSFGAGEFLEPHRDLEDRCFQVIQGGCSAWTSNDERKSWTFKHMDLGPWTISKKTWISLAADKKGCCLSLDNPETKKSIVWEWSNPPTGANRSTEVTAERLMRQTRSLISALGRVSKVS